MTRKTNNKKTAAARKNAKSKPALPPTSRERTSKGKTPRLSSGTWRKAFEAGLIDEATYRNGLASEAVRTPQPRVRDMGELQKHVRAIEALLAKINASAEVLAQGEGACFAWTFRKSDADRAEAAAKRAARKAAQA